MFSSSLAWLMGCLIVLFTLPGLGAAQSDEMVRQDQSVKLVVENKLNANAAVEDETSLSKKSFSLMIRECSGQPWVKICRSADGFHLYRHGEPYYIKGVGGTNFIEVAQASGANSIRTWSTKDIGEILDRAEQNNMTVMAGIWLSHNPSDYLDEVYKDAIVNRIQRLLDQYKQHPALLMWALGNEVNLHGTDSRQAWQFINTLAQMIKAQDPNHPVISVIAFRKQTLNEIAQHAPLLDAVGINAYGNIASVRDALDQSDYQGPYLITEWGVKGHWEVERTQWGRPIEPTSAEKTKCYRDFYTLAILKNRDRCLGSYVFLWGQKQERTPTWYSMFIAKIPGTEEVNLACAAVDVMGYNWSGNWPDNRAPVVTAMTINGLTAYENVSLNAGGSMSVQITANDPDQDSLRYVWEILEEPVKLGVGGSHESRPPVHGETLYARAPFVQISAPETSGVYRLFVYVLDESGHVGTANIPFQVIPYQTAQATTEG